MPSAVKSKSSPPSPNSPHTSATSYFTFPVTYAVSGILRRISTDIDQSKVSSVIKLLEPKRAEMDAVFHPPRRHASPFQPPPLTPLTLKGYRETTKPSARLLSRALAEEIRLLMPARLQLVEDWTLTYSLEQNGVSLATLYKKSEDYRGKRGGFVLVVRDGSGGIFGAYLTDPPHPAANYYGTGECFLWRASTLPAIPTLSSLPPPPSADTTNLQRSTTVAVPKASFSAQSNPPSRSSTPERIRFKAFPYSGMNDYMIYCQPDYISVGGGDGHYGLWLNDNFEKGISSTCPTFGNEPLSDDGTKFEVLGVELWYVG